jgi:hypothetical protein
MSKYQIWDSQLNWFAFDAHIFDTKAEAVDRLISFFSSDCTGDLTKIRAILWEVNGFAELFIRKVEK